MIDAGAAAVGCGDAVADEALVEGQVGEWPVLGQAVGAFCRRCCAVICPAHVSRWSVGCLPVGLAAGWFVLAVDVAGWLGCGRYCLGAGQAEFGGPTLDVRPEPVSLVQVGSGGDVGQEHRGDSGGTPAARPSSSGPTTSGGTPNATPPRRDRRTSRAPRPARTEPGWSATRSAASSSPTTGTTPSQVGIRPVAQQPRRHAAVPAPIRPIRRPGRLPGPPGPLNPRPGVPVARVVTSGVGR